MAQEAIFEDVNGTYIGIDLGTSNSVVTYFQNNKFSQVKFRNKKILPSVLFYETKDKIVYGDIALKKGRSNPANLIKEFKRDFGSNKKYTLIFDEEKKKQNREVFVIDTNIFIDHYSVLKEFSDEKVILSKTVISELGNLADREDVTEGATYALKEIKEAMDKDRVELMDSSLDILSEDITTNSKNDDNDNRILSIAKVLTDNADDDEDVFLVTNDQGLIAKAQGEGVAVFNYEEFHHHQSHKASQKNNNTMTLTPKDVAKQLLKYIKQESEKELAEYIDNVVITVPVNFNQTQIEIVKDAAQEAGFEDVVIQKEPIAAGLSYLVEEDEDKLMLIYDFGGGTFDTTLLEMKNGKMEVLGTDGDGKLGGKDITRKVEEFIYDKIMDENEDLDMMDKESSGLSFNDYMKNREIIYKEAQRVKEDLSSSEKEIVDLSNLIQPDGTTFNLSFELTRKEFENVISDITREAFNIVANLLKTSDIDKDDIDEIIMAGGSSAIPALRESLKEQLGRPIKSSKDTSTVISEGAAIEAMRRWSESETLQPKQAYNDVALHDFGIGIKNHTFDCLIPKGEALPTSVEKEYITEKDNQETIEIQVFQRKSAYPDAVKTYDKGIEFVDKIIISSIPPSKIGDLSIKVNFELTKNDTLDVGVKIFDKNGNLQHNEEMEIKKASNE